ncbi:glycoside hydrolase family 5 protein [Curvibacter sp. APW13]|uniref:glycoside hydrolase family 5 protein n=1 Tax=Curvibacter sp. APW13 TaxID=3077236 RepID=UPI0028DDCF9E|nr:glycoside hydrolase family 5 protein [Curvibacter sp. APW13]MDT8992594.1 glycoside hydrolase family 5 protein [Curvibacter sp. APW13]
MNLQQLFSLRTKLTYSSFASYVVALAALSFTCVAFADCESSPLRGVNLSGAEFGKQRPGVMFKDYTYPSRNTMHHFREAGMGVIRLPFLWERVQHTPFGSLDRRELDQLRQVVNWGKELNLCVLLDLHNYGGFNGKKLGSPELIVDAFVDVWRRLQKEFPDPQWVALGLMNEPAAIRSTQWMSAAQTTVLALRQAGAKNLLLVASPRWSGAHEFEKMFDGTSAAQAFAVFKDPLNHFAIELHQYADKDYSGTTSHCVDSERLRSVMLRVSTWAREHKVKLFLGEFGVANTPDCLQALKVILEESQQADVWLGWTYWSAGAWWGDYPFSIQPSTSKFDVTNGPARIEPSTTGQMSVLQPFLVGRVQ